MARGLLQRDQGPAGAVALQTTVSTCHRACVTDPRLSRVDHVGSLLRSRELLDARRGRDRGELDSAAFKAVEDDAVRHVVRLQEACGCRVVTDGEQRRDSFQSELTAAVDGFAGVSMDAWLWGDWHSAEVGDLSTPRPPQLAVVERLRKRRTLASEEFTFLRATTDRIAKVTLPEKPLIGLTLHVEVPAWVARVLIPGQERV